MPFDNLCACMDQKTRKESEREKKNEEMKKKNEKRTSVLEKYGNGVGLAVHKHHSKNNGKLSKMPKIPTNFRTQRIIILIKLNLNFWPLLLFSRPLSTFSHRLCWYKWRKCSKMKENFLNILFQFALYFSWHKQKYHSNSDGDSNIVTFRCIEALDANYILDTRDSSWSVCFNTHTHIIWDVLCLLCC